MLDQQRRPLHAKRPKPKLRKSCDGCEITTWDDDPVTNEIDWKGTANPEPAEWGYYSPPFPRDSDGRIMVDVSQLDPLPTPGGSFCTNCDKAKRRDYRNRTTSWLMEHRQQSEENEAEWHRCRKAVIRDRLGAGNSKREMVRIGIDRRQKAVRKVHLKREKMFDVKRKGILVKLDSWQKRPAVIQKYGKNAKPKIAGLKTHTADDWEGKSCKWVFVPELGSDMMHAEMTDRNRLQDGRLLVDGESERAEALADETMEEFSQAMVNLNPTSDRGVVKRKDGGEVKLPAFTMEVRYQHQIKCNIFNE